LLLAELLVKGLKPPPTPPMGERMVTQMARISTDFFVLKTTLTTKTTFFRQAGGTAAWRNAVNSE